MASTKKINKELTQKAAELAVVAGGASKKEKCWKEGLRPNCAWTKVFEAREKELSKCQASDIE